MLTEEMMHVLGHALEHTCLDILKILPFLFFAFLLLEGLEHYSLGKLNRILSGSGKAGPLVGTVLGLIPQCGFSIAAANLYCGGVTTLGTLLAVFLATSDEAVLIFLSNPGSGALIIKLLAAKVVIGVAAGYGTDLLLRKKVSSKHISDLCGNCGCHEEHGILKPAIRHTVRMLGWLFVITLVLEVLLEGAGIEGLAAMLQKDSWVQPLLAGLIGLIPNCAASVLLAELYLAGVLGFGAAIAGLSAGAGLGVVVLLRMNANKKEVIKILALLYGIAVLAGMIIQFFMP